jgi:lipopolysaccharide export system permease protein
MMKFISTFASTWQRYFFKEFAKSILFILGVLYGLYVLIDAMAHLKDVAGGKSTLFQWIEYYLCTFSRRVEILLPFAILLASVRCLCNFQQRGELVALLASGISLKSLMRPFLYTTMGCVLLLYVNYQWILPAALPKLTSFAESRFGREKVEEETETPREVMLEDFSKIIYGNFNPLSKEFSDVFWIRNIDTIFHCKTLSIAMPIPVGKWVDKIERNQDSVLEKVGSFELYPFKEMQFNKASLKNSITPPPEQSLTQLITQYPLYFSSFSHKAGEIKANLYFKFSFPWLCVIAFIALPAFCLRFTRNIAILPIYLLAISTLFCLNVAFQAAFALAKTQVIAPSLVIAIPWAVVLYFSIKKFRTI